MINKIQNNLTPTVDASSKFQESLPLSSDKLLTLFRNWSIDFKCHQHIPLNTVEESKNIQSKLWKPIHLYGLFEGQINFPVAEHIFDHHLRLPIHNNIKDEEVEFVCSEIKNCLEVIRND